MPFNLKFDYIIFGDVLEHLKYPYSLLEKFKNYLSEKGKFIISLPNVAHACVKSNLLIDNFNYTKYGILDDTHLRFFTYKTIAKEFANINLYIDMCFHTFGYKEEMQPVTVFFSF